jgi:hypothetical protein
MWQGTSIPNAEDTVEYHVYSKQQPTLEELKKKRDMYMNYLNPMYRDHLWQEDSFHLLLCEEGIPHLYGTTRFGDNIEDEWFIVHLLVQLSEKYPELIIKISDSDGQFLLIEAALALPRWVKPENSENRVWLTSGEFHLVPLSRNPMELITLPPGNLSVQTGLRIMQSPPLGVQTKMNEKTQQIIKQRISDAVQKQRQAIHWACCYLPKNVAYLLHNNPQLVSKAVLAYYHRDHLQIRKCRELRKFTDTICEPTLIRFTRTLYAQLIRQPLNIKPKGLKDIPKDRSDPSYNYITNGYKLLCGLEILYWESYQTRNKTSKQMRRYGDIYKEIDEQLEIGKKSAYVHSIEFPEKEDSDNWLNVSPEEVNDILLQKQQELETYFEQRKKNTFSEPQNDKIPEDNLFDKVVGDMKMFMNRVSDCTGIEHEDSLQHSSDNDEHDFESNLHNNINSFMELLRNTKTNSSLEDPLSSDEDEEFYAVDSEDSTEKDPLMMEIMEKMDLELQKTHLSQSFEKVPEESPDTDLNEEKLSPVDVNLNLVKNFLESYAEEHGEIGPVSTILNSLQHQ